MYTFGQTHFIPSVVLLLSSGVIVFFSGSVSWTTQNLRVHVTSPSRGHSVRKTLSWPPGWLHVLIPEDFGPVHPGPVLICYGEAGYGMRLAQCTWRWLLGQPSPCWGTMLFLLHPRGAVSTLQGFWCVCWVVVVCFDFFFSLCEALETSPPTAEMCQLCSCEGI